MIEEDDLHHASLVASEELADRWKFCPPCNGDCARGQECPAKSPLPEVDWQRTGEKLVVWLAAVISLGLILSLYAGWLK